MSTTASHQSHRLAQITAAGGAAALLALGVTIGPTTVWSDVFGGTDTQAPAPALAPAPSVSHPHVIEHPCFRAPLGGMPDIGGVPMCTVVVP